MTPAVRKSLIAGGILLAVAAAVAVYAVVDPNVWFMPKCAFKMATGLDCPGCGSQRAVSAMLHGDFRAAWGHNAALFIGVPWLLLLSFASLARRRFPALFRALYSRPSILITLAAVMAWWVGRNIFG